MSSSAARALTHTPIWHWCNQAIRLACQPKWVRAKKNVNTSLRSVYVIELLLRIEIKGFTAHVCARTHRTCLKHKIGNWGTFFCYSLSNSHHLIEWIFKFNCWWWIRPKNIAIILQSYNLFLHVFFIYACVSISSNNNSNNTNELSLCGIQIWLDTLNSKMMEIYCSLADFFCYAFFWTIKKKRAKLRKKNQSILFLKKSWSRTRSNSIFFCCFSHTHSSDLFFHHYVFNPSCPPFNLYAVCISVYVMM